MARFLSPRQPNLYLPGVPITFDNGVADLPDDALDALKRLRYLGAPYGVVELAAEVSEDEPQWDAALPATLEYATVTARGFVLGPDFPGDVDAYPSGLPFSGAVTFTPSQLVQYETSPLDPVIMYVRPVVAGWDETGQLVDGSGNPGLTLLAPDSPGLLVQGWQWVVSFELNHGVTLPTFAFDLASGQTVDLATVAPAQITDGVQIIRGQAGPSAYEIAVDGGFVGTEAEWLASLVGPQGDPGPSGTAVGFPTGGTAGQTVVKQSATDYDFAWETPADPDLVDGGSSTAAVTVIQLRRDTAANWTTNDPTLASGEAGVETDTSKMKLGDGVTAWTALAYIAGDTAGGGTVPAHTHVIEDVEGAVTTTEVDSDLDAALITFPTPIDWRYDATNPSPARPVTQRPVNFIGPVSLRPPLNGVWDGGTFAAVPGLDKITEYDG